MNILSSGIGVGSKDAAAGGLMILEHGVEYESRHYKVSGRIGAGRRAKSSTPESPSFGRSAMRVSLIHARIGGRSGWLRHARSSEVVRHHQL